MTFNKDLIFLLTLSTIFAFIEIEIEGKYGWAEKLPTAKIIPSSKVTYYHLYIFVYVSIVFLFIYGLNSYSLALIILFFSIEDFLWFILNPNYGITKYNKENIWWHKKQPWFLYQPLHNYMIIIGLILISILSKNNKIINLLGYSIIYIIFVILVSPFYHLFHKKTHLQK
jgi:hypothetical protein